MSIRRPALLLASALALLAASSPARADTEDADADAATTPARRTLAILAVDASSTDLARGLEAELEARLEAMPLRLIPRPQLRQRLRTATKWTEGCLVGSCLSELRTQTGADIVLVAALTGSGTTFGFVVTLVRTDTGRVLVQDTERCDVCTPSEATASAVRATVKLVHEIPSQLPDEAAQQGAAVDLAVRAEARRRAAERQTFRRVGWMLTLVGVVAAGAGATFYFAGYDRPTLGLAAAAAGGGLAVGGLTVLTF